MVGQISEYFKFLFLLGKYLQLEGNWTADTSSRTHHSSLLNAKRSCLMNGNCFGIQVIRSIPFSMEFPIWMKLEGSWYIHQKAIWLGNLIYYICWKDYIITLVLFFIITFDDWTYLTYILPFCSRFESFNTARKSR